jgi:hypothetical protein
MKRIRKSVIAFLILLSVSIFSGCSVLTYGLLEMRINYENPQWAPPYYSGARYYYLPDLESYYDLSTREFIFLNDGQWCYSYNIPSLYAGYDLNNCFAIVLDVNVFKPWMHHQYYLSHYPRYYYRDYYDHSNIPYVRGFNENSRSAVYWKENERGRARSWDNQNIRENRDFKYSKEDRQQQKNWNNQTDDKEKFNGNSRDAKDRSDSDKKTNTTRSQSTNYYGKIIGNSVKVNKQMRDKSTIRSRSTKTNKSPARSR